MSGTGLQIAAAMLGLVACAPTAIFGGAWLVRRAGHYVARWWRLPPIIRHGTPREGGRGTLAPQDEPYASSGHLERTAATGGGLVTPQRALSTTDHQWAAMQAKQRHETPEERTRRAMAERAWSGPW